MKVLAIGGGSGLSVALRGLKHHVGGAVDSLHAVVTVSDDGGSSGRLRRELGVLPPGDIRNCLVAVADDEDLVARLFQYRFTDGGGLAGHSFGNLLLTALTGITGDFYQAILKAEEILAVRGRILPATLSDVRLTALGASGRRIDGESAVGRAGEAIAELALEPADPAAFRPAVEAIQEADVILLGPGSLYTSILPNLLIPGILQAVRASAAAVVLPLNLMTQPGETDGLAADAHVAAIERHAGGVVDVVLAHDAPIPAERLAPYEELGARPVGVPEEPADGRWRLVRADLLDEGDLVRHHPAKLARAVLELARGYDSPDARDSA